MTAKDDTKPADTTTPEAKEEQHEHTLLSRWEEAAQPFLAQAQPYLAQAQPYLDQAAQAARAAAQPYQSYADAAIERTREFANAESDTTTATGAVSEIMRSIMSFTLAQVGLASLLVMPETKEERAKREGEKKEGEGEDKAVKTTTNTVPHAEFVLAEEGDEESKSK